MKKFIKYIAFISLAIYLIVPLIGTFLYAFSTDWSNTILPQGLTIQWFIQLLTSPEFLMALARSTFLSAVAVIFAVILIVPSIFAVYVFFPKLSIIVEGIVIACYSLPGVILATALMNSYSSWGVPMIVFVIGSYIVSTFPIICQGTLNSLRAIDAQTLLESAEILGASKVYTFRKIILPNIAPGVFSASLFSFSTLFGEFVIVNLVLGAQFQTVQIYLRRMLSVNGHLASAVVVIYFTLITIITLIAIKVSGTRKGLDH